MCSIGVAGVPSAAFAKAQSFEMAGPARLAAPSTPAPFRNVRRFSVVMGSSFQACGPRRPAVTPPVYPTWVDRVLRGSERRMKLLRGRPPTWKIARPRGGRAIWTRRLEEVQFGSGWNCAGPPPTRIVVVFAGPVFVVEPDPPAGLEPPALATMSATASATATIAAITAK